MYQGENAKFIIELEDAVGNIIPKMDINELKAYIYGEADRRIYLRYSIDVESGYVLITPITGEEKHSMILTSTQTSTLPPGRYMIKIVSNTNSVDFMDGLVDIEEAPLFTIVKTIKDG